MSQFLKYAQHTISSDDLYFSTDLKIIRYVPNGLRTHKELFSITVDDCEQMSMKEFGVKTPVFRMQNEQQLHQFLTNYPDIIYLRHTIDDLWMPSHFVSYVRTCYDAFLSQV
jgi:hypothetical protein